MDWWWDVLDDVSFHRSVAHGMMFLSLPTFAVLYFVLDSPWGKHAPAKRQQQTTTTTTSRMHQWWLGPSLQARISWFVFEVQNLLWSAVCWTRRDAETMKTPNHVLLTLFVVHYINRAILHPLRMNHKSKPMPLLVVLAAFVFCTFNGYLQAQNLCRFQSFPSHHSTSLPFVSGIALFGLGMHINLQSDATLRSLRRTHAQDYQIPRGGLFEYCSGAHYFGELVEWTGFAVACDDGKNSSYAAWAFVTYTAANHVPRAVSHHRFYQETFRDYPKQRRAIVPFLW